MKRHGNLWEKIISKDNLRYAHSMAKRGKGHYSSVQRIEKDVERYIDEAHKLLISKQFTTGEYQIEDRIEGGKLRTIYKLPYFPDRIVHHAAMAICGPIFRRSLIRDTFQSLPERGTSDARRRIKPMIKQYPYALKMDIKKYYPSVNNDLMKRAIRRKIKCKDTLWLLDDIIDSHDGLPIGNLTSQYFGNVYLTQFDWWVKQQLGVRGYFRYCDDLILLGDKQDLIDWRLQVTKRLASMGLEIKPCWQIKDLKTQGVDFVGYVFYHDKTKLRKSIALNFKEKAKSAIKSGRLNAIQSLVAYKGWMMQASCKMLWRKYATSTVQKYCDNVFKTNPLRGKI